MKKVLFCLAVSLFVSLVCFGKAKDEDEFKFYDDVKYDTVTIKTVALLPFKNNVGKQSAEEVQDLFNALKIVFEKNGITVIDAMPEIEKQKIDIAFDEITADQMVAIGTALQTDAVLSGTIYKYQTSKKGIATVGITGNLVYVSLGSYIYRAKLAREKKISAAKKWITGVFRGESKANREKALQDCSADLMNPVFEKLGIIKTEENKEENKEQG